MSDDVTVRDWLADQLAPLLPDDWTVIEHQRVPQTVNVITVVIKHTAIEPLAEAPKSWLSNEVLLTVIDPHQDQDRAEDALDDEVLELVTALDALPNLAFVNAKKVLVDPNLGWDITLKVNSRKKNPEPDTEPDES